MAARKSPNAGFLIIWASFLSILISLEIGYFDGYRAFYYNTVRAAIMAQANYVTNQLHDYSEDMSGNFSGRCAAWSRNLKSATTWSL
jgi:hypothetical protein